jgi:ferredoxin-NADP reductase
MLQFERTDNDQRPIAVTYVVHDRAHAAYHGELEDVARDVERISYRLWATAESGRLSARDLLDGIGDLNKTAFMICGSASFAEELSRQLRESGVPWSSIFSEGFAFR